MKNKNPETQYENDMFIYRRGTKYYKIENGTATIIRIVNIKNSNTVVCILDELYDGKKSITPENTFKLTIDELKKNYKLLLPNGQICMVNVKSNRYNIFDTILVSAKIEAVSATAADIKFGEVYAMCRQAIIDIFSSIINPNEAVFGASISRKTCPSNIVFEGLYSDCELLDDGQFINIYQQDTIDQILGLLKTTSSDTILTNNYNGFKDDERPKGVVKDVESLVKTNAFINDIQSMYDIIPMPDVTINLEDNIYILKDVDLYRIEYAIKCRMKDVLIVEYNHFISEEDISPDYQHIKICDSNNKVYIIQFTSVAGFAEELYPDSVKADMTTLIDKYKR